MIFNDNSLGSMPPHSKLLAEEGATFRSFKLVQNGVFDEKGQISYFPIVFLFRMGKIDKIRVLINPCVAKMSY